MLIAVATASESPYPYTNLVRQLKNRNVFQYSKLIKESIPIMVLDTKIEPNPIIIAFLRPILEIVKEWIGVQHTPANWKQQRAQATMV